MIYRIVRAFKLFLDSCPDRSSVRPLLVPAKRRTHPSLRRALLVVMCLNRWKASLKYKFKARKVSVISAFQHVLNRTIFSITPFDEASLAASWRGVLGALQKADDMHANQALGMESTSKLLTTTPQSSIRIDVISLLTVSWKNRMVKVASIESPKSEGEISMSSSQSLTTSMEYSSLFGKSQHKLAFLALMNVVQNSAIEFCKKLCDNAIALPNLFTELNLFYCNIKYLQLVIADKNNPYSFDYTIFSLKYLKEVLIVIDEKFSELQMSEAAAVRAPCPRSVSLLAKSVRI